MLYKINNGQRRVDLKDQQPQIKLKQLSLREGLTEQDFHYDASDLFERITKSAEETVEKLLKQSEATTGALDVNESFLTNTPAEEENPPIARLNPDRLISLANTRARKHLILLQIEKLEIQIKMMICK